MNPLALFQALSGYKTYIVAVAAILYIVWCKHTGQTPDETVLTLFGALGLGALRHGAKTDLKRVFTTATAELTATSASAPLPPVIPPGQRGFMVRPMMLLLAGLSLVAALSVGCVFFKAPPDRQAFTSIQFTDTDLATAYDLWVPNWQGRYDTAKAAADSKAMDTLKAERTEADRAVKAYQAAHRTILADAEKALSGATNGVLVITLPDDNTKAELLHALLLHH